MGSEHAMAKLTVTTFVSLDGVMQGPGDHEEDTSGGFELGGWLVPYADEDFGGIVVDWFAGAEGFLLGRKTYEIMGSFWPTQDDPVASKLNNLPKYVVSESLTTAEWANSTIIKENVVEEIAKLKTELGGELQVHGSSGLIQTLVAHDLVDEYRLFVFPVVLGRGKRLFEAGSVPTALRLVDSKTTGAGVTAQTYQRAGEMQFGTVIGE
jgi:dihydrofolate reductase